MDGAIKKTLSNAWERVDMSNTDDVWYDGYHAGYEQACADWRDRSDSPYPKDSADSGRAGRGGA